MLSSEVIARPVVKRIFHAGLLLVIPLILFITSLDTIRARDKAWYAGGYDPEYAYLFNSLNMATFRLAGHVDHPGTTMQVAGGVVLRAVWMFDKRADNLTDAVLAEPEHYIRILNIATAVTGSLVLLVLGWFVTTASGMVWYGILLQLTPFISGFVLFNGFARATQEVMQMSAAFAMAALALHWYFETGERNRLNYPLWFGVIAGFGMASKIIFFPLMLIPLILLRHWSERFRFGLFSILAFFVFTLPVIRMYPHMFHWIYSLFIHSGQYGSGSESIIDTSRYFTEFVDLFRVNPRLFALFVGGIFAVAALALVIWLGKQTIRKPAARLLFAVVIAQTAGYLLIAKQPKAAYLLPYESIAAIPVIVLLHLALLPVRKPVLKSALAGFLAVMLSFFGIKHGLDLKHRLYGTDFNPEFEEVWGAATGWNEKTAVVFTNPGASPMAGLFFGNAYSRSRYVSELQRIYPDYYILDAYNNRIIHWGGEPFLTDSLFNLYGGRMAIMHTPGWVEPDSALLRLNGTPGWQLVEAYRGRGVVLVPVAKGTDGRTGSASIVFNSAEIRGVNDSTIRIPVNMKPGDQGVLSFDRARSGKSSVISDPLHPFALGVEEQNVEPGELFKASVWVSGDAEDVVLVASALNSDDFYRYSGEVVREERKKGWKQLHLEFITSSELEEGILKIYVWNKGRQTVYLDDFRCERIKPVQGAPETTTNE